MMQTHKTNCSERFDFWTAIVVGMSLFLMLVTMSFWPYTKKWFGLDHDTVKVTPLGEVTRVTYVGGFWINTQIDTVQGSYLLRGAISLPARAMVELRESGGDAIVCLDKGGVCRELVNK